MFKKLLYGMAVVATLASCSEDFTDWTDPQANGAEGTKTASLTVTGVDQIDLATVTTDSIKIFNASVSAEEAATATYEVVFSNEDGTQSSAAISADNQGRVSVADLTSAVESLYGKRPTYRTLTTLVSAYITDDGQALLRQGTISTVVKPEAPVIESAYYLIGAQNGWSQATCVDYKFNHSDADVYDDPVFTITVAAPYNDDGSRADFWFKIVPESSLTASDFWADLLGSDTADGDDRLEAGMSVGGGSFVQYASDNAKYYQIQLNMLDYKLTVTPLAFEEWIYMPGNPQGWNPATAPMLHSPNCDGIYTGYGYMDGDFKFTKGPNWDAEYNWSSFTTYSDGFSGEGTGNINQANASYYYIEANVAAGSLTATPATFVIKGDITPAGYNDWSTGYPMEYDKTEDCWTATLDLFPADNSSTWGFKFVEGNNWFGGSLDDITTSGGNLNVSESGTYTVKLYASRINGNTKMYATMEKVSAANHRR